MESTTDKEWASKYLLDPLTAPEPSQEDGPGNTFRPGASVPLVKAAPSPSRHASGRRLSKTNPYRKSSLSNTTTTEVRRSVSLHSAGNSISNSHGRGSSNASPAASSTASPILKQSPHSPRSPSHRQAAFGDENKPSGAGRRRGSSLSERYPGDMSHRPLDQLAKEKAAADRARYATKKHHIPPDIVDNLDHSGGTAWHHGGPYDATLFARNNSSNSPLDAVASSNAEALKATPRERIIDSVVRHRPLDGVAAYPPGYQDPMGNVLHYEEGDNMMIESSPGGGAYKRWPGIPYLPEDIKGKGEPSYSIEKALKEHSIRDEKDGNEGIELQTRHRSSSGTVPNDAWDRSHGPVSRSGSMSKRLSGGLKKRFGSIKRRSHHED